MLSFEYPEDREYFANLLAGGSTKILEKEYADFFDFEHPAIKRWKFNKIQKKVLIESLVLIRGGGSLESLLPFNNETLVREIVNFPVPVLVGVGHERDISFIGLAADRMVSTPTAAAQALNESWQKAEAKVQLNESKLISIFGRILVENQKSVESNFLIIKD